MLPKVAMMKITQICIACLWERNEYLHKPLHIAWSKICMQKKSGALGLRDCLVWHIIAAVGKYV